MDSFASSPLAQMAISLSSSTGALRRPSPSDSVLLSGQHHVRRKSFLGFASPARRVAKPLLGQTRHLTEKQNRQKVLSYQEQDIPVLEARSIEDIYDALTERLLPAAAMVHDLKSKYALLLGIQVTYVNLLLDARSSS